MMLTQEIFEQAALLAGQLDARQTALLEILCQAAASDLENRLREGLQVEDCQEAFTAAASLFALAALKESGETGPVSEFRAGDLTIRRSGGETAADSLRQQAAVLMRPYLKDSFLFAGV